MQVRGNLPPRGAKGFARGLTTAREKAGYTKQSLADAAGVSLQVIRLLERGKTRAPQPETWDRLNLILGNGSDKGDEIEQAVAQVRVSLDTLVKVIRQRIPKGLHG